MSCKNNTLDEKKRTINHLKARISFNDKILDIIQSVSQMMADDMCEDYDFNPNNLPEDDFILVQCLVYIWERAGYDLGFSTNIDFSDKAISELTDEQVELIKLCVDELCERTDDIIEWLNQVDKEIYKKQYHQYLEENGYYD